MIKNKDNIDFVIMIIWVVLEFLFLRVGLVLVVVDKIFILGVDLVLFFVIFFILVWVEFCKEVFDILVVDNEVFFLLRYDLVVVWLMGVVKYNGNFFYLNLKFEMWIRKLLWDVILYNINK